MIYDQILVRYGDLTLKGKNQKIFLQRLFRLIDNKMKGLNVEVIKTRDRTYIKILDEDYAKIIERLSLVSGIHSYSPVLKCKSDLDDIKASAKMLCEKLIVKPTTFKVETKRADKNFFMTSQEITKVVASHILKGSTNLIVDVHNPELTLNIELRNDATYLYMEEIKGMGGYPVSIAGKGLVMISGGIDSPVAGFLAQKQGIEIECIHFESTPLTSIESAQKVVDLVKIMAKFSIDNKIKLHMIPFKELHMALLESVPESYNITVMRRMMYRIADIIAKKNDCSVIINGESVGQVASQTLQSMNTINAVTNMPILRPLCTYDKNDIVKIAKQIGTFNESIKPFEDCCTVYVPKAPATSPKIDKAENFEKAFDYEALIAKAVENTKTVLISVDSTLSLPELGLEVRNVL